MNFNAKKNGLLSILGLDISSPPRFPRRSVGWYRAKRHFPTWQFGKAFFVRARFHQQVQGSDFWVVFFSQNPLDLLVISQKKKNPTNLAGRFGSNGPRRPSPLVRSGHLVETVEFRGENVFAKDWSNKNLHSQKPTWLLGTSPSSNRK